MISAPYIRYGMYSRDIVSLYNNIFDCFHKIDLDTRKLFEYSNDGFLSFQMIDASYHTNPSLQSTALIITCAVVLLLMAAIVSVVFWK